MITTQHTITEWVDIYTDALYEWACYKLSDNDLAKDLVQDTFIAAFQNLAGFTGKSNPKTWLFSILNNKITDHYRKEFRSPVKQGLTCEPDFFDDDGMWRKERRPVEWSDTTHLLDDPQFAKVLSTCLGKLPAQWASAVHLKYLDEKDGPEVCKDLNITTSNYWQIIHRAKLSLRQCLEMNWFK